MTEIRACVSCGTKIMTIKGSVSFKCPNCNEVTISRCGKCRRTGILYLCPNCSFEGP